ncbi:hypothetical protein A3742_03795 [Oleiphilus sp. HI0071]|nr:hypothetical protein A3737_08405 [Oleiphilus sp. HI0065]KZY85092.1 hypothetical protein A3742_30060 [Oleiphilus sp. HI0071]KZY89260.1 hypothetical protein A3744_06850 [Oleiphilus sp. HI0073]KZZ11352.1 hypothetical protein A3750_19715 [Oleiphilus sp. HI0079]KZZ15234.1 hypothetical protein A3751_03650 [Oleiphilus sp. HI0080]
MPSGFLVGVELLRGTAQDLPLRVLLMRMGHYQSLLVLKNTIFGLHKKNDRFEMERLRIRRGDELLDSLLRYLP